MTLLFKGPKIKRPHIERPFIERPYFKKPLISKRYPSHQYDQLSLIQQGQCFSMSIELYHKSCQNNSRKWLYCLKDPRSKGPTLKGPMLKGLFFQSITQVINMTNVALFNRASVSPCQQSYIINPVRMILENGHIIRPTYCLKAPRTKGPTSKHPNFKGPIIKGL